MTLQELRYFCVTAEVLHYTRASRLLYISQPSLSYAISKLEQELGVQLFKKNGKNSDSYKVWRRISAICKEGSL